MRPKWASTTEEGENPTNYGISKGEYYWSSKRRTFLSRNSSSYAWEQFHSDWSLEEVDQRAPNNSKKWQCTTECSSARGNLYLLRMGINDRTAYSRQLAVSWFTATDVLMSVSSIRRRLLHHVLSARVFLYKIHLTVNHRWLCLQRAHEHRAQQAVCHQVVVSDESCFNFWGHNSQFHVCYTHYFSNMWWNILNCIKKRIS